MFSNNNYVKCSILDRITMNFSFGLLLLTLLIAMPTILECAKKGKKDKKQAASGTQSGDKVTPTNQEAATNAANLQPLPTDPVGISSNKNHPAISNNNTATEKSKANSGKGGDDDTFDQHRPVAREAKRADEIRKHGPVSRHREDYKTMKMAATSDFDQSLGI